jgi:ribose transport system permease protein
MSGASSPLMILTLFRSGQEIAMTHLPQEEAVSAHSSTAVALEKVPPPESSAMQSDSKLKAIFNRIVSQRELFLLIFIFLFGIYASFATPYFLDVNNFKQILIAIALDGIVAVGMTIVLVGGGIDLSVGSVIGFAGALIGLAFGLGLSIPVAITLAMLGGVMVGAVNGGLISYLRINPIITTLAMMGIARSATYIVSGGYAFSTIPDAFKAFAAGNVFGIPNTAIVTIALVLIFNFLLKNSAALRKYFYIGGNESAAYKAGIRVDNLKFFSYVLAAAFAALAGILLVSRLGSTFPHSGLGTELRVISACIIGGASINGGKGTIIGAFLGVLLLGLINNILVLTNVSVYWQGIVSGTILILAVATDVLVNRTSK